MSYEEDNWPRLSPRFRDAHNALRVARGQPAIPSPVKDEYVTPIARKVVEVDLADPEFQQEIRALTRNFDARLSQGSEGFDIREHSRAAY